MDSVIMAVRIGYPCINLSLKNPFTTTFRLKSFSEYRLKETIKNNLNHLYKILKFNLENNILFFRISSDLIPFASHPVCQFDWDLYFNSEFEEIGKFVTKNKMRISMHPDQFVILNSNSEKIVQNSIRELRYHSKVMDIMGLSCEAKIQIHVGGVYGNKTAAKSRFIRNFNSIEENLRRRIIIENDDRSYSLKDCLDINNETGLPIVFDTFHHECLSNSETIEEAITASSNTWKSSVDGYPIIDYSSQSKDGRKGKHAKTIEIDHFIKYYKLFKELSRKQNIGLDIMLEIKDKEKSALLAIGAVGGNK
ncbi:MAG: UV DNA damage repair endonuclease UvsE [Candidatus Nitrosocosmicus sp.]